MRRFVGTRPIGVWIALASILFLLVFGIGGQSLSLVSWDLACRLGLQENRFDDPDVLERAAAHFEWGSCAADVLVVLPLLILGFVGVACRRHWGAVAALMAAACWIYAFFDYTVDRYSLAVRGGLVPWEKYSGIVLAYGLLGALPSALVVVGIAANMDRFAARRPHSRIVRSPGDSLPGSLLEDLLICTGQVLWTIPQVWIGGRRTWNVTAQERARELPADGMVKDALKLDRAITIARPPAEVWPWVARFGRGAGYYSWDFLDNRGHRHADYLVDAPEPAVGDANKLLGTIRHVDAGRELVWYEEADDFQKILGARVPNAFAFRIDPSEGGGTRVHLRLSIGIPRTLLARAIGRLVTLLDHVMATEMLRRLKFLVETHEERSRLGETNRALAPHQKPGEFRPVTAAP